MSEGYGNLGKTDQTIPGQPKNPWGKWPKVNPETVAPLREGKPDLYNHQPTRFVSKDEAKARGWKHFWTGELCVTGHRAARYVSNSSTCVDCVRVEKGQLPSTVRASRSWKRRDGATTRRKIPRPPTPRRSRTLPKEIF